MQWGAFVPYSAEKDILPVCVCVFLSTGFCFVVPFMWFYTGCRTTRAQREKQAEKHQRLTIIWISRLHTCRSYSLLTYILFRAQRTPWLVFTRNTIAKPPVGLRGRGTNYTVSHTWHVTAMLPNYTTIKTKKTYTVIEKLASYHSNMLS